MSIDELEKLVKCRRQRYEMLGMMNTAGMIEVERMQLHLQYDDARRQLVDSEQKLREALLAKGEVDSLILRIREPQ